MQILPPHSLYHSAALHSQIHTYTSIYPPHSDRKFDAFANGISVVRVREIRFIQSVCDI